LYARLNEAVPIKAAREFGAVLLILRGILQVSDSTVIHEAVLCYLEQVSVPVEVVGTENLSVLLKGQPLHTLIEEAPPPANLEPHRGENQTKVSDDGSEYPL
jgi:hypothetical protein